MTVSFPIRNGAVQLVQVQNNVRKLVGAGFGDASARVNRWFIHTSANPTMRPTSEADTTFEPLASQDPQYPWALSTWVGASDPGRYHTTADDTTSPHSTRGYLRHQGGAFNYIKTRYASMSGVPDASVIVSRIQTPFDQYGQVPPGASSQCDPQVYKVMPIDATGSVPQGATPIAHLFVPSRDPVGAPLGITTAPYSLEIWFILDPATFPAPPAGLGFMVRVETMAGAPTAATDLASVLTWIRNVGGYTTSAATTVVTTTTYFGTRPIDP